jgi:hypothetical protein
MWGVRRPVVLFVLLAAAACAVAGDAWGDAATEAHEAYDRGTRAFRRGDYATAAREYAAADALSPSPVALQAALDSAVLADDPVLGVELIDRAKGAPRTNALALTILTAQRKFARRTGRIHVACGGASTCIASVDGAAVDPARLLVVRVGAHTVIVDSGGTATTRDVTVGPDETIEVAPAAAPASASSTAPAAAPATAAAAAPAPAPVTTAPPPASVESGRGISPVWFYLGLGATGIAGVATIVSGVDTANQHSEFTSKCGSANPPVACPVGLASSGQSAQTRTNVLLGVTAGLAAVTVVTVFFVRWHDTRVGVSPAGVTATGRF